MIHETIKKNGVSFGVVLGIISVLITTLIYVIDLKLMMNYWIGTFKILIYLILFIVLLVKTKKELSNIFSFKDAFTTFFITAIIGITIGTIFEILLFNFIDPSAKERLKEITLETVISSMEKFDTPKSVIKEAIISMKNEDQMSVFKQIQGLFMTYLISTIFGFIFAAFFKTRNPSQE